ncbi:kinase-like domain-containing protein [Roridomyces roridus]|uniref:Kinase-like domain-containing protein n=1 Tax=Roridomyces roridus TaxID=1738132 RepID=A0AAD7C5W3_9AGAR|nr:kinase-like domain-containing protein [Roridomyces roridus]
MSLSKGLPEKLVKELAPSLAQLDVALAQLAAQSHDDSVFLQAMPPLPVLRAEVSRILKTDCLGACLLGVGSSNVVFLVWFADGTDAVPRIRYMPNVHPPLKDMQSEFNSEIATMQFLASNTTIPVPRLLHWNAGSDHALEHPYMLTSRIAGNSHGCKQWQEVPQEQRLALAYDLGKVQAQLFSVPLRAIGRLKDSDGTVGPLPGYRYPFRSSKAWLVAQVHAELQTISDRKAWAAKRMVHRHQNDGVDSMPLFFAVAWFSLLLKAIQDLPDDLLDPDPPVFYLRHPDLDSLNVIVNTSGQLTGVVDWQGAEVRPLWAWRPANFILDTSPLISDGENNEIEEIHAKVVREQAGHDTTPSKFDPRWLLYFVSGQHSVMSSRAKLNKRFTRWYSSLEAENTGRPAFSALERLVNVRVSSA